MGTHAFDWVFVAAFMTSSILSVLGSFLYEHYIVDREKTDGLWFSFHKIWWMDVLEKCR